MLCKLRSFEAIVIEVRIVQPSDRVEEERPTYEPPEVTPGDRKGNAILIGESFQDSPSQQIP